MTEGLGLKRCSVCRKAFCPKREWQKTCSPECSKERNKRNSLANTRRKSALQKDKKSVEPILNIDEAEPMIPELMHIDGVLRLCGALFYSARREKDWAFFDSELARFIYDTVGADIADVRKTVRANA